MKLISLHCDYIKFKPLKKALKNPEELSEKQMKGVSVKDPLVILTAVEAGDTESIVTEYVKNVVDIAGQVKAKKIVLYPYAHLSSNLSSPDMAVKILDKAEKQLTKTKKFDVFRAPFGYYKEFELKCKGHPLSELSREIGNVGKVGKKDKSDRKESVKEKDIDIPSLVKKLTKVKMSAPKGEKGKKSNVELGRDLDLYIVSDVIGQGLPLLTPKGTTIFRELEKFITDEELKRGYLYTRTPVIAKSNLYKISGHWQHYQDSMFVLDLGNEKYALRPMTCPFQFVLYKRKPRSYKELPLRYAEVADLFRNEQSGELRGLTRVRQFSLADAHIICTPEQVEKEFEGVVDLLKFVMKTLGINEKDIWYRFSKWNPKDKKKYINQPKAWSDSEKAMKKILNKLKIKHVEAKGEAAFYGPKLDLQYKDVYGKEDTLLTVQIDFALPERYDMTYKDREGKSKRPMIIHRSSIGALERMMAYLLEKNQGVLPTWLSPIHVKVLSMTDKNVKYAKNVVEQLRKEMIRVELDDRSESVGKKVRDAELMKIPYIIVVGDKEQKAKSVAVRVKGDKKIKNVKIDKFIRNIKKEITDRK